MVNQTKSPCEDCIVKMICTSQMNCDRRRSYIRYSVQAEQLRREHILQTRWQVVDSYFKKFRRRR